MNRTMPLAALLLGLAALPASAQPPAPQGQGAAPEDDAPTRYLVGQVSADGRRFTHEGGRTVALMVTEEVAAEVPRRVDLGPYRGRRVVLLCEPWFESSDTAWGCEAIGPLSETRGIRARPR